MKTQIRNKIIWLLVMVMMTTTVLLAGMVLPARAGENTINQVYQIQFPRDGDANYDARWGQNNLNHMNGWKGMATKGTLLRSLGSYRGTVGYCVEPGTDQNSGDSLQRNDEQFFDRLSTSYNHTIDPTEMKLLLGRILQYGYCGPMSTEWISQNENDANNLSHIIATQLLVWETIVGERNVEFDHVDPGEYDPVTAAVGQDHPLRNNVMNHYNEMVDQVKKDSMIPSFCQHSLENIKAEQFTFDGQQYTASFEDSHKVLGDFEVISDYADAQCTVENNVLTVTAKEVPANGVTLTLRKKSAMRKGIAVWSDGQYIPGKGIQDVISPTHDVEDKVEGFLKLTVVSGEMKIVKTSEDGKVEGHRFIIEGNGMKKNVETDKNGQAVLHDMIPGSYFVSEETTQLYNDQEKKEVIVEAGKTAVIEVNNTLKKGSLKVIKIAEDKKIENLKFHLSGTSLSGKKVEMDAVTGKDGVALFSEVPVSGDTPYTLSEVDTDNSYVLPAGQEVVIEWNQVTEKTIENRLKKFVLEVEKADMDTKTQQGDASLAGAKYGVYKGETLLDEYITDGNGRFTTKEYPCANDLVLKEIEPSEGYLLDESSYTIKSDPKNYKRTANKISQKVLEEVIKGDIAITKHTDNGETKVETPEAGATFEIYLKTAGSYDKAAERERDRLVCDKNGFAKSKLLPYGVYIVHQTKAVEGSEKVNDFEVFIAKHKETYSFIINDAKFQSHLKVIKQDAETGKNILYKGAGFEIYDADGKRMTMTYTYPKYEVVSTFYTDDRGILVTPEKLVYGKGYSLVEVQAPYGYVLDSEPVYFDINEENSSEENGMTVVKVIKKDKPQKGTLTIEKTGEIFSGVSVDANQYTEPVYQPVYEMRPIEGAKFKIYPEEDIYTPDGTLRYKKGEVVDTIVTGTDGLAKSKELYLGKYLVQEIEAPKGQVLDHTIHKTELTYAGQETAITEAIMTRENLKQKAKLSIEKALEVSKKFGIGESSEIQNIKFGFFADEELVSASGTAIPKDALIEIIHLDEKGRGKISTDIPFGKYYVRELAADKHYQLSEKKYPLEFQYSDPEKKEVELKINDGKKILNELIFGTVKGKKTDSEGKGLEGAVIGLFAPDTTKFTKENAILSSTSKEDGSFLLSGIPFGKWKVKEIEAPEGYLLNDEVVEINVEKDAQILEVTIVNEAVKGKIELLKFDKEYPDNKLTGGEFTIYQDSNHNEKPDKEDKVVGKLQEVEKGVYRKEDLPFGLYFVKETKAPEGFRMDKEIYTVAIESTKTYKVENNPGVGFMDQAQTGSLKVLKTSSDHVVKGFIFHITGENGYDVFMETDKNGEIIVDNLRVGKYTISEYKDRMSSEYIRPKDETVEIKDGKEVVVKMHNKRKEGPKTGDESHVQLWLMMSGLTFILFLVLKRRCFL